MASNIVTDAYLLFENSVIQLQPYPIPIMRSTLVFVRDYFTIWSFGGETSTDDTDDTLEATAKVFRKNVQEASNDWSESKEMKSKISKPSVIMYNLPN